MRDVQQQLNLMQRRFVDREIDRHEESRVADDGGGDVTHDGGRSDQHAAGAGEILRLNGQRLGQRERPVRDLDRLAGVIRILGRGIVAIVGDAEPPYAERRLADQRAERSLRAVEPRAGTVRRRTRQDVGHVRIAHAIHQQRVLEVGRLRTADVARQRTREQADRSDARRVRRDQVDVQVRHVRVRDVQQHANLFELRLPNDVIVGDDDRGFGDRRRGDGGELEAAGRGRGDGGGGSAAVGDGGEIVARGVVAAKRFEPRVEVHIDRRAAACDAQLHRCRFVQVHDVLPGRQRRVEHDAELADGILDDRRDVADRDVPARPRDANDVRGNVPGDERAGGNVAIEDHGQIVTGSRKGGHDLRQVSTGERTAEEDGVGDVAGFSGGGNGRRATHPADREEAVQGRLDLGCRGVERERPGRESVEVEREGAAGRDHADGLNFRRADDARAHGVDDRGDVMHIDELRQVHGANRVAEWVLAELDGIRPGEILSRELHGEDARPAGECVERDEFHLEALIDRHRGAARTDCGERRLVRTQPTREGDVEESPARREGLHRDDDISHADVRERRDGVLQARRSRRAARSRNAERQSGSRLRAAAVIERDRKRARGPEDLQILNVGDVAGRPGDPQDVRGRERGRVDVAIEPHLKLVRRDVPEHPVRDQDVRPERDGVLACGQRCRVLDIELRGDAIGGIDRCHGLNCSRNRSRLCDHGRDVGRAEGFEIHGPIERDVQDGAVGSVAGRERDRGRLARLPDHQQMRAGRDQRQRVRIDGERERLDVEPIFSERARHRVSIGVEMRRLLRLRNRRIEVRADFTGPAISVLIQERLVLAHDDRVAEGVEEGERPRVERPDVFALKVFDAQRPAPGQGRAVKHGERGLGLVDAGEGSVLRPDRGRGRIVESRIGVVAARAAVPIREHDGDRRAVTQAVRIGTEQRDAEVAHERMGDVHQHFQALHEGGRRAAQHRHRDRGVQQLEVGNRGRRVGGREQALPARSANAIRDVRPDGVAVGARRRLRRRELNEELRRVVQQPRHRDGWILRNDRGERNQGRGQAGVAFGTRCAEQHPHEIGVRQQSRGVERVDVDEAIEGEREAIDLARAVAGEVFVVSARCRDRDGTLIAVEDRVVVDDARTGRGLNGRGIDVRTAGVLVAGPEGLDLAAVRQHRLPLPRFVRPDGTEVRRHRLQRQHGPRQLIGRVLRVVEERGQSLRAEGIAAVNARGQEGRDAGDRGVQAGVVPHHHHGARHRVDREARHELRAIPFGEVVRRAIVVHAFGAAPRRPAVVRIAKEHVLTVVEARCGIGDVQPAAMRAEGTDRVVVGVGGADAESDSRGIAGTRTTEVCTGRQRLAERPRGRNDGIVAEARVADQGRHLERPEIQSRDRDVGREPRVAIVVAHVGDAEHPVAVQCEYVRSIERTQRAGLWPEVGHVGVIGVEVGRIVDQPGCLVVEHRAGRGSRAVRSQDDSDAAVPARIVVIEQSLEGTAGVDHVAQTVDAVLEERDVRAVARRIEDDPQLVHVRMSNRQRHVDIRQRREEGPVRGGRRAVDGDVDRRGRCGREVGSIVRIDPGLCDVDAGPDHRAVIRGDLLRENAAIGFGEVLAAEAILNE